MSRSIFVLHLCCHSDIMTVLGVMKMPKTANLHIRTDPEIKDNAEQLFLKFGITITDAINMFLHQSLLVGG